MREPEGKKTPDIFLTVFFAVFMSFIVGVGPASIMVGNLVAGKRIAQAAGRDLGLIEDQDLVRKVNSDFALYSEHVEQEVNNADRLF